jgi:hypothetical protein
MEKSIVIRDVMGSRDKNMIAELLFEQDDPYFPLASLTEISDDESTFFGACPGGTDDIRACSSYKYWLIGSNDKTAGEAQDIQVVELAATLVRKPLGGFKPPMVTMQQLLTFARLMDLLGAEFDQADGKFCLLSCIATKNCASMAGLTGIGLEPIKTLPRWLQYEHRTWFPRLSEQERRVHEEAQYLWMPPEAARSLVGRMAAIDAGRNISRANIDDPELTEDFAVKFETNAIRNIKETYGSLKAASESFNYEILQPPPSYARFGDGFF